jgi:hypothetical protein
MTLRASWPRTEDLAFEPELAPLALLDAALAITVQALIASNPELLSHGKPPATPPRATMSGSVQKGISSLPTWLRAGGLNAR